MNDVTVSPGAVTPSDATGPMHTHTHTQIPSLINLQKYRLERMTTVTVVNVNVLLNYCTARKR